jgi:hypothetical protein
MPHFCRSWRPAAVLLAVYLLPASASAQPSAERPGLRLPTIAASSAAAADWASTYHALKNYRVREVNPLLRPFESTPGKLVSVGAIMDGAAFGAWNLTIGRKHPRVAAAGLWAMAGFRTYLAIHNMRNTRQAARR